MLLNSVLVMLCLVVLAGCLWRKPVKQRRRYRSKRIVVPSSALLSPSHGFPQKKPDWVRHAVLELHGQLGLSHRKLAEAFNQLYFASTGQSVGRTWVRQLLIKHACEALHLRRGLKHRVPLPLSRNVLWGIDTTCVTDSGKTQHIVFGMVDHGARLNLALRYLKRFNTWTFLGCLFLAMGEFGRPCAIKTDNHPVFHAKRVRQVLGWCGVRRRFSRPAAPWENGYIERLFGTFKERLAGFVVRDVRHLRCSLAQFQFWYNVARPHQHLGGCTPDQVWRGVDPYRAAPKTVRMFSAWEGRLRGLVLRH